MRIPVLMLGLLVLNACERPSPMPSGYTYHTQDYRSPPGADPQEIGYAYSAKANAQVLKMWENVAAELLSSVEASHNIPQDSLYLETPYLQSAQLLTLDYALRQELESRGYNMAEGPGKAALKLEIEIRPVPEKTQGIKIAPVLPGIESYQGAATDFQKRLVAVKAMKNNVPAFTHQEIHTLPNFGYLPDHGGYQGMKWNRALGKSPRFVPEHLKPESYNN